MSNWREQLAQEEETQAAMDVIYRYWHYPVLAFLVGFAFVNRVRNYSNFIVDGNIYFSGNDPWYHVRSTEYAVNNFPSTMPFDPWTGFPVGRFAGQFGTLFDQLIALVVLIVGLGSPDQFTARFIILVAPAFFGVLICLPAYLIGHRLGDRFGGIIAVMFVALAPDRLLQMTLAGHVQHHSAEVLFMGLAVFGFMLALAAAHREKPVYELVADREFDAIRGTLGYSMLAGVGLGTYLWVWPPGVWMYGILGAFFVLFMCLEHVHGRSPEHAAFVGVIGLGTAALLQLGMVRELTISATGRTILQPGLGLLVVAGLVFFAWLSRELDSRDQSPLTYPAGVVGTIVAGMLVMALILPDMFNFFLSQADRSFGFFTSPTTGAATIGEAQPADLDDLFDFYRFAAFTALLGAILMLIRHILDEEPDGQELFIVVWAAFLTAATFTQIRFSYYMTLPVGALNAALVGYVMTLMGSRDEDMLPETYQILTVIVVVFVMFVPMMGLPFIADGQTAVDMSDQMSHPGNVMGWSDSLDWMAENTPEQGQYANPDGDPMEYYGTYDLTDDFEYPPGAYGVLSWWDYGHWITVNGERIPNANPFQQHATEAAEVLLAQDEAEAKTLLEERFDDHEDAQTQYVMVDALMVETETQVMTDQGGRLVGGKFFAPADFHPDYERSDFYTHAFGPDDQKLDIVHQQPYYQSLMVRLYHHHGSAVEPEGFVVNWQGQKSIPDDGPFEGESIVTTGEEEATGPFMEFTENVTEAQELAADDPTTQVGGIGAYPEERIPALEHFRLVHQDAVPAVQASGGDDEALFDAVENGMTPGIHFRWQHQTIPTVANAANAPWALEGDLDEQQQAIQQQLLLGFLYPTTQSFTKTFERVDGGTIEGTINLDPDGPTPDTLDLTVQMEPENGLAFSYDQEVEVENGQFETTVPYSTAGYDELGVDEGYTEPSVTADGPYQVTSDTFVIDNTTYQYEGTVNVTEAQVVGEDETPATVTLERTEVQPTEFPDQTEEDEETENDETDEENGADTDDQEDTTNDEETTTDEDESTDNGDTSSPSIGPSLVAPSVLAAPLP